MTKNWMKVLGVFAALAFVVGCQTQPTPTPECTTDAQCDDGLFCTGPEACVDNVCEQGTAPCNQLTQECDEENDTCIDLCTSNGDCGALEECVDGYCVAVECTTNADCDDGLFCTGVEECVDGACVEGTGPCTGEDETCDENLDVCTVPGDEVIEENFQIANSNAVAGLTEGDTVELVSPLEIDASQADGCTCLWTVNGAGTFDDQLSCTTVNYTAGTGDTMIVFYEICGNVATAYKLTFTVAPPAACEDDDDCDTGYICQDGECIESTDCNSNGDCADDEYCDTTNNVCREIECNTNADCDDGLWCTGEETCVDYVCVAGTPPCGEAECDEETETCAGETYVLTVGPDNYTGEGGDDYFDGTQDLTTPATPADTLNATDTLDGGAGTDTLYAVISNDVTPAKLANIEVIKYTMTAAKTLTATQATGLETLTNFASSAASIVTGLIVAPDTLNITNCANNTTVTITSNTTYPTLTGASDTLALNLDSATAGTVTVQPAAAGSGYETINLDSGGSIANSITLDDGNGNSLTTLNITGEANCTLAITPATITTFNGSNASGNLTFDVDTAASTVKGGSGDDIFQFAGNYTGGTTDVDGGAGTDELQANSAQVVGKTATVSKVANIETVGVTNALGGSLDVTYFGATNATLRAGSGAQTITMPTGGKLTFAGGTDTTGNVTVTVKSDTGADTIDVVFDATAGPLNGDDLLCTTFETMNLEVKQTSTTDGISLSGYPGVTQTINLTGSANLTAGGTTAVVADKVDGTSYTGVLTITMNAASTVIGGSGNDVITGSANEDNLSGNAGTDTLTGAAGSDALDGGAGADTLLCGAGSDIMTGGTENDTFKIDGLTAAGSDTNVIKDFDAATSTTSADVFYWDISALEGLTVATDLVDTSANSAAAGDHTYVAQTSDGQTIANADIVGIIGTYTSAANALANKTSWTITYGANLAADDVFLIAYTVGSNVHIAACAETGGATSDGIDSVTDICKLEGVTISNLNTSDFNSQA